MKIGLILQKERRIKEYTEFKEEWGKREKNNPPPDFEFHGRKPFWSVVCNAPLKRVRNE